MLSLLASAAHITSIDAESAHVPLSFTGGIQSPAISCQYPSIDAFMNVNDEYGDLETRLI